MIFVWNGLISLVREPTRGPNNLDRIYSTSSIDCNIKVVKSAVKSDHSAIILSDACDAVTNFIKVKRQVQYRAKSPAQNARFLSQVNENMFDSVYDCDKLQLCADNFYSTLMSIFDYFFPIKCCTVTNCDPPFITPEIKALLRKKNSLMRNNKIAQASAISEKIGKLIARHNSSRLSKIISGGPSMWDEVKRLTGTSRANPLPASLTASSLNSHYSSISTNPGYSPPQPKSTATQQTNLISEFSVFFLLDHLRPTASGPDDLPFWFLRLAAPFISKPLTYLINMSLMFSSVPSQWKTAVIHPIPKIPSPTMPADMRPISVVSVLSRLTERLVVRNFFTPIIQTLPALSNQFAYRPTCSTTAALISLLSHITFLLESNTSSLS